jgi:type IV pilus assembly protein PilY1
LKDGGKTVFTALGALNKDTKDLWNASALSDQGLIEKGGVYEKLRLPTVTSPSTFRTVVTDIASVNNGAIVKTSTPNSSLLTISSQDSTTSSTTLLDDFKNKNILKDLSLSLKVRLLNYLGYDLDLATTTTLPATLTPPKDPFVSMGASIHSYPVQLTYSGDLDANGDLTDTRQQSVLYASMEGGLRIVDAQTGAEQMVFLPADILNKDASRALRRSEPGSLTYGVDGAWLLIQHINLVALPQHHL